MGNNFKTHIGLWDGNKRGKIHNLLNTHFLFYILAKCLFFPRNIYTKHMPTYPPFHLSLSLTHVNKSNPRHQLINTLQTHLTHTLTHMRFLLNPLHISVIPPQSVLRFTSTMRLIITYNTVAYTYLPFQPLTTLQTSPHCCINSTLQNRLLHY